MPLFPSLYNVAVWLCRNPTDAEDLVQETFLKALRGFATFEPGSNFKAWIFRILRNTWLTSRSGLAAQRTIALEDELESRNESGPAPVPEGAIDRQTPELNLIRLSDQAALRDLVTTADYLKAQNPAWGMREALAAKRSMYEAVTYARNAQTQAPIMAAPAAPVPALLGSGGGASPGGTRGVDNGRPKKFNDLTDATEAWIAQHPS